MSLKVNALEAGTPVAYGRIVEWKGRPEVDIFWGGESALFDKLADQKLIAPLALPKAVIDTVPASIGKPKPIFLKDPKSFWVGTALEPYGLVYHPKLLQRLGVPEPKDWNDLLRIIVDIGQCVGDWQTHQKLLKADLGEFHEYSVEWQGEDLVFAVDGTEVARIPGRARDFQEPMFAILNFAKINEAPMEGAWVMEEDWVRHESLH